MYEIPNKRLNSAESKLQAIARLHRPALCYSPQQNYYGCTKCGSLEYWPCEEAQILGLDPEPKNYFFRPRNVRDGHDRT